MNLSVRPREVLAVAIALLFPVGACSKARPPAAVVEVPSGDDAGADAGAQFAFQSLGCGTAGTQSAIAVSGSKIGVASLASTTTTSPCTLTVLGVTTSSVVPVWNVCYAEAQVGGTFASSVVTTQPYTTPSGVAVAFDSAGNAGIAYTGVGSTPASERCGANDIFYAKSSGAGFGAATQVSNGSMSNGLVAAQAGNCVQNVCGVGDVTGLWPALAFDSSDNPTMAYRDVHYGFAADDFAKSDVEFTEGSGGSFQVLTIDVSRGGGDYNRIAFTKAGLPAVLQFDQTGGLPGVYLDLDQTSGGFAAQEADGGWTSAQVSSGQIGNGLGFAISSSGVFGASYFDESTNRLVYIESNDGLTWGAETTIDVDGSSTSSPSLAFDENGDPAVAYYRCSASTCNVQNDGLYLARRVSGTWAVQVVHADPATSDGLEPALAFANGKPMIAFQVSTVDAIAQTSTSAWWIAEGQ